MSTITDGQLAPAFRGKTHLGEDFDLEEFRGQKVWIGFYRWASCPLCNLRIKEVMAQAEAFEKEGIKLVAVFQSTPERIAQYVGTQNPPFPLIADPDMALYETYGVQTSWLGLFYPRVIYRTLQATAAGLLKLDLGDWPLARVPADFLVDPEGLVWKAYYGSAISDHIPFEDVSAFGEDDCLEMPQVPF